MTKEPEKNPIVGPYIPKLSPEQHLEKAMSMAERSLELLVSPWKEPLIANAKIKFSHSQIIKQRRLRLTCNEIFCERRPTHLVECIVNDKISFTIPFCKEHAELFD